MTKRGGREGRVIRFNVDDPDDLRRLTVSGVIWQTAYVQRAVDAIRSGAISLDECRDVPPRLAALLRASGR